MSDDMLLDWIIDNMQARGWNQTDLARMSGLNTGAVSNLLNRKRRPGIKSCTAIAHAFRVHPSVVLKMAGLMDSSAFNPDDDVIAEINAIYSKLDHQNKIDALEYIRLRLRLQDERGENATLSTSPKKS